MNAGTKRILGAFGVVPLMLAFPLAASAADDGGRIDHIQNTKGTVQVLFSVPGLAAGVSPDPATVAVTIGGKQVDAEAQPVDESSESLRRTSVLAMDVSESMSGPKFEAAKNAAIAYVEAAPSDVYVGLVTFASDVQTVQTPTQDRSTLIDQINALKLTTQTHLYGGVVKALKLTGTEGQRSVLLLSDGKDSTSAPLPPVLSEAKKSGVRVDVFSLGQEVPAGSPLDRIAETTAGVVTVTSDLDKLKAQFTEEASDLAKQLIISFEPPGGETTSATLAISVQADGQTVSDSAFVTLKGANDGASTPPAYVPSEDKAPAISKPLLIGGVVMLFVGMASVLGFGMMRVMPADMTPMQQQLSLYTVHGMRRSQKREKPEQGAQQLKDSAVALADKLMEKRDFEESLSHKLDRAGLQLKAAEWLLLHVGIAIAAGVVGALFSGGGVIVTLIFLVGGLVLPYMYLSYKEKRRIKAFNSGLAQTLQIIAGALQAGLSLPQAIDTVVKEGGEPVASEFRRAIIDQRLGVEIEDSLDTVAERMGSIDFKWVVMAVRIQREVGGNLAELLLNVAATIREREYLRRQVSVLSAEGRLSAFILGGLPPFFVAYLALARPTYLYPMTHTTLGWEMIGAACVSMTVGVFWLKKAIKVEV